MNYIILSKELVFPDVSLATPEGVLAIGGDLSSERLILAYRNGIFPWYNQGEPIVWYAPPKRMVLFPEEIRISKSMRSIIKKNHFQITINKAFEAVIANCRTIVRKDQDDTWITDEMHQAYINLHHLGYAKSIEVWKNGELVGGLYGVAFGDVFCGESMFSKVSNASKLAFIHLASLDYKLIDCQMYTDHLASLGAREIHRSDFSVLLSKYI